MATAAVTPSDLPVTLDDVRAAAARLAGAVVRTPTLKSRTLSELTGAEVWLKFENLQFTAAYKERGALNKLLVMDQEQRDRRGGRQSRPGPCLSRQAARHPGDDRHANGDADHQSPADRGPWRDRDPP